MMNDGQTEQLQEELAEAQIYFKQMAKEIRLGPLATRFARWANCIGTARVLLDVFREEWIQSVRRGEPGVETPNKT